jgi:ATP-binding cassette subfamily C protein
MLEGQKKRHYSLRENYIWLLKQIWQLDKTIYLYFAAFTVISAVKPFIAIVFPRFLLQELMGPARPQQLALLLGSFFLIGATVYYLFAALSKADQTKIILFRISVLRKHQDKCLETDFQNTEDPLFLNASQTALDGLDGNGLGLGGILDRSFHLSGNLLAFIGYMAIVSRLSPYVLVYLLINVVLSFYFTLSAKEYETAQRDPLAKNNRRFLYLFRTMYDFSYGKELRLQGYRGNLAEKTKDQQKGLLAIRQSIYFKNFQSGLADTLLMLVREGIIYFYLIQQVISGQMSIPDFTMYFATVAAFAHWFTEIVGHYAHIRAQNGYIDDIRNFRNQPDILASKNARPLPEGPYTIEFRNVSFHYPRSSSYVYKNLNLIIPTGQKLAIVGHNGAGKTTFVKLLCRLYDVNEGEILLNGINIKEFDKDEYYKKFSVVFQDIKPLAFSVAENVTLTQHEYDNDRLWKALEDANVAEKVRKLPKQVNTPMLKILDPEGVEFSGGEAQKIAIARALYKQGDILIMDEPTAALDALAESQIYLNFDAAVHGRTAIYISHRLASTFFCDVIAMFEQGKLVEYGSHNELMLKGGKYADMFETQARYYKDNPEVAR